MCLCDVNLEAMNCILFEDTPHRIACEHAAKYGSVKCLQGSLRYITRRMGNKVVLHNKSTYHPGLPVKLG